MSLLDEASSKLSPYKAMMSEKAGKEVERKFIIQPHILRDILEDEMSKKVIDKKAQKEFKDYRSRVEKTEWRLAGVLNFVDADLFREQIDKTIEGILKHIKLRQPNGEWVVFDYEIDIRTNKSGDDALMLAVKFVDAKNEQDLRYQNGVPLVDVKVDVSGSNRELIEAIKSQGAKSNDEELKEIMKQFIAMMAQKEINAADKPAKKTKATKAIVDEQVDEMPSDFEG